MTTPSAGQPPPGQEQEYPGRTAEMDPRPRGEMRDYQGRGLFAAHPDEIAPSYVFSASGRLSSYHSGEVLARIGGETLPG